MAQQRDYLIRFREKGLDELQGKTKRLDGAFENLAGRLTLAAGAAATFVAGFATLNAVQVAGEFEALRVRLENMYGSMERGNRAFETFQQLAATTPFSVKQVVEAGATLKAFGLDAESTIKTVADLAAFMGRDLVESASAVGRAFAGGIGASEILREGGIINRVLTRTGKTVQDFSKDLPGFRKALFETFQDPTQGIAGATDKLANTFQGAVSNAGDAVDNLAASIGEKLLPQSTEAVKSSTELVENLTYLVQAAPDIGASFEEMAIKARLFVANLIPGGVVLDLLVRRLQEYIGEQASAIIETQKAAEAATEAANARQAQADALAAYREQSALATLMLIQFEQRMEDADAVAIRFTDSLNDLAQGMEEVEMISIRGLPEMADGWDLVRHSVNRTADILGDSIFDQLRDGKSLIRSFRDAFIGMIEDIAATLLARSIIWSFINLAPGLGAAASGFGTFGSFLLSGFGGGGNAPLSAPGFGASPQQSAPVTVIIQANDALSFERYLREQGGGEAIKKVVGEIL